MLYYVIPIMLYYVMFLTARRVAGFPPNDSRMNTSF